MIRKSAKSKSIVNRQTRLIIGIIIFQAVLFVIALLVGGVIHQAKDNAYQLFHDKTMNRNEYLQREMKNNWTNFSPYLSNIVQKIPESKENPEVFFQNAIPDLMAMLRATQATGAFIILIDDAEATEWLPTLYLRDYDPIMNSYGTDDIYMLYGPSDLANELRLPLDQTWRNNLEMSEENKTFIVKPYENATTSNIASLLGYWSKPFKLNESDVSIITYSMPLFDHLGILRGVIGIDITLNYFTEFLPIHDLEPRDSLGYMIAYSTDNGETLYPIVMQGSLQKRMIPSDEALEIKEVDADKKIYQLQNQNGMEVLYTDIEKIGLYQYNTPFESEQWYLVGIMKEDYLLRYVYRIMQILLISFTLSIIVGAISGAFGSYRMTKPIVDLARHVKQSDQSHNLVLEMTGLTEVDELSKTIELANKIMLESASRLSKTVDLFGLPIAAYEINHKLQHVFITEKFWATLGVLDRKDASVIGYDKFIDSMKSIFHVLEEGETDVYRVEQDGTRWYRYRIMQENDSTIGVVIDVTEEMHEKIQIKQERDHDALTALFNRKGFQEAYERWRKSAMEGYSAIVMFDLDNLKKINDTYGHKWGDQYILKAVEFLSTLAPKEQGIIGRRSGDEFLLLLHGYEKPELIIQQMNNFYQRLSDFPISYPDGKQISVSISGGLMWINQEEYEYDMLLHYADEALYEAKNNHKGYYVVKTI